MWLDVKGYEGLYQVSDKGQLRNRHGKIKRSRKFGDYLIYTLCRNNVKSTHSVHRLVAEAFIPNPESLKTVNHIDCNPLNNVADNLEWKSQHENILHSVALSRHCHGETHGCHKLTDEDVLAIRRSPLGCNSLSKIFPVTPSTIKRIRSRKIWKHVA